MTLGEFVIVILVVCAAIWLVWQTVTGDVAGDQDEEWRL